MQVYNLFLLMLTAIPILVGGISARSVSKNRATRTVAGMMAPMLILTVLCIIVEMVVAGYEETAALLFAEEMPYMTFPRHVFTVIISCFFAISALSVLAIKRSEKTKPLISFSVLSGLTVVFTLAAVCISLLETFSDHSFIVVPVCIIYAIGQIYAVAAAVLTGEKKLEKFILYFTNIIYLVVCGFLIWFAYSSGFADEAQAVGEITSGVIAFIILGVVIVAGPALISFFALLSNSIGSFKYVKKG